LLDSLLQEMEGRGEVEVDDLKDGSKGDKEDKGNKGGKGSMCRMAKKIWKLVATSSLGLMFLLGVYCVAGAYLFIYLEYPLEDREHQDFIRSANELNESIDFIADYLSSLHFENKRELDNCSNLITSEFYTDHAKYAKACPSAGYYDPFCICVRGNRDRYHQEAEDSLKGITRQVLVLATEFSYTGDVSTWEDKWTVLNSLLFTLSSLALIGYGHIAPRTFNGKMTFIVYTILGLPIVMVFLAHIGDSMAAGIKRAFSRFACRMCRVRRRQEELGDKYDASSRVSRDIVGQEDYMPTDQINVPIVVTLVLMGVYVVGGGAVFSAWEDWDMVSSCYFTFITLTTVGFGDYVPGSSFRGNMNFDQTCKMGFTTLYCLLGLAIIAMGINLASEQVVAKCTWFAYEVGLKETEEQIRRRSNKKSEGVRETPKSRMGKRHILRRIKKTLHIQDLDSFDDMEKNGNLID